MVELPYVLEPPFEHVGGFCWRAKLPDEMAWACDDNRRTRQSPLQLCEGRTLLGPSHAPHAEIESLGLGRYSFWSGTVYFAASDNEDPNRKFVPYRAMLAARQPVSLSTRVREPRVLRSQVSPAKLGILGLGLRGRSLARQLARIPGVAVASIYDVSTIRIEDFARTVMPGARLHVCSSFEEMIADRSLDGIVIATPDHMHARHAVPALEAGKSLFLEKPIATTCEDGRAILETSKRTGRPVQVGFVLRYSAFYEAIREEISSGTIGTVVAIDLADHLGTDHGASYRRRWHRRSAWSGGMMIHKGCHDLDLIEWLSGQTIQSVASTGGPGPLGRRPAPATHCSICPEAGKCRHRFDGRHLFVARAERLAPTKYDLDRCVYGLDQDIVEVQTALMELSGGARASFRIDMCNPKCSERPIRVVGERGTILGKLESGRFEVHFNDNRPGYQVTLAEGTEDGHGGGDIHSLCNFLRAIAEGRAVDNSLEDAFRGLCAGVAAEIARADGRTVALSSICPPDISHAPLQPT